jgi:hypothetical protein
MSERIRAYMEGGPADGAEIEIFTPMFAPAAEVPRLCWRGGPERYEKTGRVRDDGRIIYVYKNPEPEPT